MIRCNAIPSAQARLYRFGIFELDARSRELRKHGVRIKLQEQPTQILSLLLAHAGEVVTREQIQKQLWPDNTFVDFDNAISSAVRKLREALGDTAENPRLVETLARRGYRFIAPVSQDGKKTTAAPPRLIFDARHRWALALLFAIPAALISVWMARQLSTPDAPDVRFTPLTTYPGHQLQPSFSPEGTRVAFSWDGSDGRNADIYLKLIGPGDPIRLTTDLARDFNPAWSPDGRRIAALRNMGRELAVLLIPVSGGPQREVTRIDVRDQDLANGTCRASGCYYESTLAWSPDGNFLFTSSRSGPDSSPAIVRINVETGEKQPVTAPPLGTADLDPSVSPDGRALAFLRTSGFAKRDVWVVSLSSRAHLEASPRRLTIDQMDARRPQWTPEGRQLIFSSDRRGRYELWRLPVTHSGSPTRLEGVGGDASNVGISPRGKRLVYEQETSSTSLWKVFIGSSDRAQPLRVTSTTRADVYPHYSPDGKRIAFESNRTGVNEIWVCDGDGSNAKQVTAFGKGHSGTPRWSPDGRTIAFDSNVEGNWDIWAIRPEGGHPVRLTLDPADDAVPRWSRHGEWIYFSSRRSGHAEIWKMRADGSTETQVTNGGGVVAEESPDARYLYYKNADKDLGEAPLWRMPVEGGPARKVIASVRGRLFTPTEDGIFFATGQYSSELRFFDLASGTVRIVAPFDYSGNAVISPDGQWALYERSEHSGTNLILLENFR